MFVQPKNLNPSTWKRHERQMATVIRMICAMADRLGRNPTSAECRRCFREYRVPMTWVNLVAPSHDGLLRAAGLVAVEPVRAPLHFPTAAEREQRRAAVLRRLQALQAQLGRTPRMQDLPLVGLSRRQVRNAFGDLTRALQALAGRPFQLPEPDLGFTVYLRSYVSSRHCLPSYREIAAAGWTQEQVTSWGGLLYVADSLGLVMQRAS